MSRPDAEFLSPSRREISTLSRRRPVPLLGSAVRSRSMPNARQASRNSMDDIRETPSINVQDCNDMDAPSEPQLCETADHTEFVSSVDDNIEVEPKLVHATGNGIRRSRGEPDFMLSLRSRRSGDSDAHSNSETIVPRRNLTVIDVAALIFNKMVGTGIFTTPGAVLAYTKSKPVSLVLWLVGGIWTMLYITVYLEFGSALPFNGGELIYLDEVYPTPELLATILFSGFFLVLGNSYGNSVTFAKQTILASEPHTTHTTDLDSRLVRLIAIVVLSVVCLLHYFSNRFGLFMNKLFAIFKTALLFTVFVAGVNAASKPGSGRPDFGETHGQRNSADGLAAMVLIFYSYQGWENANYVAGEIRAPARTLKIGAYLAISVVTVLYILVTLAYYLAVDYETITNSDSDLGIAILFAPRAFGSSMGLKVCIALSAFGNLIAVTFTSSKVKQAIAVQRIIPFYKFFRKDINTPKGALVLHWISSTILILVCPTSADGYSFAVGLFTYGHIIIGMFVTLGLYRLAPRIRQNWPDWELTTITNKYVLMILPIVIFLGSLIILVWGARPKGAGNIPRFWWPIIFFLIIAGSFLYWAAMMITTLRFEQRGKERSIGSVIGFEVKIYNETDPDVPQDMAEAMAQSRLDGSRRRVVYVLSGPVEKLGYLCNRTKDFVGKFMF